MPNYGAAGQAYKVEGARELRASLRRAGDDLADLKTANREAADIVAPAAQRRSPHRSSKLAGTVRPGATKTAAVIRAGNNRASGVPYANPIHWGWFKRNIKPNPFLSLAAQETEQQWRKPYEKHLEDALAKIKGAERP